MASKSKKTTAATLVGVAILAGLITGIGAYSLQSHKISDLKKQVSTSENQQTTLKKKIDDLKKNKTKKSDTRNSEDKSITNDQPGTKISKQFGYIKKVYSSGGKKHLTIDYAQMLTGEEADKAAIADGIIPEGEHIENDYYITNINKRLRTFTVDPNVKITMKMLSSGGLKPKQVTFAEFKGFYDNYVKGSETSKVDVPYWVELKGSVVLNIEEQYIP